MAKGKVVSKQITRHPDDQPISLAGLDFETALHAAMATGKAPPPKPKKAKRKAKK
ncbi:MAG: hypothetical protein WDM86_15000 [Rhizomicrobium sp.]